MQIERWAKVVGYEDRYEISDLGRFKILDRYVNNRGKIKLRKGKIIDGHINGAGYRIFSIYNNGKRENVLIHRLVALHFIDNPRDLPIINHIDGNKLNNRFDNLEWCTQKHNLRHARKTGLNKPLRGEESHSSKLNEGDVGFILKNRGVISQRKMAKIFGVTQSAINCIHAKINWKHITI